MEALETETAVKNSANPSVKAKSEMENSESYPRTTERYIYNTSNSKDEYYERIADEYSAILQRETEEKNKEPGAEHQQQESNETGWRNQINDMFREHLRSKLMHAVLPQSDGFLSKVRSMKNLQLYVSEIENDIYKAARSKTEYFHLLAEKQLKVLQEVDSGTPIQLNIDQRKKRQTRQNEQNNQEYQQQQAESERRQQQQRQQQQQEQERLQQQQQQQLLQQIILG